MNRAALLIIMLSASSSFAQDMPLRDWTKDGEGWRKVDGKKPERNELAVPVTVEETPKAAMMTVTANVLSHGGETVFTGFKGQKYLWALPVGKGGAVGVGQPYASLRCPIGKDATTDVSSLSVDMAGRIYAATPLGVQVFDPTGRLSGVLLPPARGEMKLLGWEKDVLVVWIGERKYTRKMNAMGK